MSKTYQPDTSIARLREIRDNQVRRKRGCYYAEYFEETEDLIAMLIERDMRIGKLEGILAGVLSNGGE